MTNQLQMVAQSISDADTATKNAQDVVNDANKSIDVMKKLETDLGNAESVRVQNESTRQSNEELRQQTLTKMNDAANNANTAADRANKAAQDAESIVAEKIPAISIDFINSLFS